MCNIGADFIATGEVVGQRPMSQMRNTMNHIEKETGMRGRLLRPLSAKLLRPTIVEMEAIVDRNRLLDINGRSRKIQFDLARHYEIEQYEAPSGGCLFTDPNIARRVHDLFQRHEVLEALDLYLLTLGRHLRINKSAKIIVGRNMHENEELEKYKLKADYFCIPEFKGPVVYGKGSLSRDDLDLIGRVILRYGKKGGDAPRIKIFLRGEPDGTYPVDGIISNDTLEQMRV